MKLIILIITTIISLIYLVNAGSNDYINYEEKCYNISSIGLNYGNDWINITVCKNGCWNNTCIIYPECPTCNICSGGGTNTVYKNNTINKTIYVDRPYPVYLDNETVKNITVEKIVQVNKPFYFNIWFYGVIALLVFIGTMYLINSRGE